MFHSGSERLFEVRWKRYAMTIGRMPERSWLWTISDFWGLHTLWRELIRRPDADPRAESLRRDMLGARRLRRIVTIPTGILGGAILVLTNALLSHEALIAALVLAMFVAWGFLGARRA